MVQAMDRRVLITGVAGFLGANLLSRLLERGYKVVGVDNLSQGSMERIAHHVGDQFEFFEADVCDLDTMRRVGKDVHQIIHLAEIKIPRYSNSLNTLETNSVGTENLLRVATEHEARFILGSTDEVYGRNEEVPLNEESALVMGRTNVRRWSLGVSKVLAEHLCFAYQDQYGLPVTILRYFGGYGRYQSLDWQGGPQSVFITAALRGESMPIHGDGLQTRTFSSIDDLVEGTILAMESPLAVGEIVNIASRESMSIINLAYLIWRSVGRAEKPKLEFIPYSDFSRNYEDVRHRSADISKAYYLLGYEPKEEIFEGLQVTIRWQAAALGIELDER